MSEKRASAGYFKGVNAARVARYQSYREPRGGGSAVDGTGEVRLPADAGKITVSASVFRVKEFEGRKARSEVEPRFQRLRTVGCGGDFQLTVDSV